MSNDRRTTHAPAAGTTFLATDFPVLDETDLVVKRTRASVTTTLVLDIDYTLSGIGNDGGAFVTLAAASLADDSFQLDGESAADRVSDYDPEQTPSGDQMDADLNRLTHLAQENRRDIVDLKVAQGLAPQIELGVDGGAIVWRPVSTLTWFTLPGLTYPPHGHVIADVTGLQAALDGKLLAASVSAAGLTLIGQATAALQRAVLGVTRGIKGVSRNLQASNGATNPNFEMTVTADELLVKNAAGDAELLSNVNVTGAITTAGANGLDTGTEANSTWYYVHVIYNGTTAALLFSTSATAPTMPGGYTHAALATAVFNDGSGNFRVTRSFGRKVFQADVEALNGAGVVAWTALSLTTCVPAIAVHVRGRSTNTANQILGIHLASDSTGVVGVVEAAIYSSATTAVDGQYGGSNFDLPILATTPQTIYRKHNATSGGQIILINGFELPLGM